MKTQDKQRIWSVGFWLPCGHANFYDQLNDKGAIPTNNLSEDYQKIPTLSAKLQCSVLYRLCYVLSTKFGYDQYYLLSHQYRKNSGYKYYPNQHNFNHAYFLNSESGRILIVNDSGFYQLVGKFNETANSTEAINELQSDAIKLCGNLHIPRVQSGSQDHVQKNIKSYSNAEKETDEGGILALFQINAICEGLYNGNFDTRLYFHHPDSTSGKQDGSKKIEDEYDLKEFIKNIIAYVNLQNNSSHVRWLSDSLLSQSFSPIDIEHEQDILCQFLRYTLTENLRKIKWRIEECRRELLPETIASTSTHHKLIQIESPSGWEERIENANESQLVGYVKLLAAKLPLLLNVRRHLDGAIRSIRSTSHHEFLDLWSDWNDLATAIENNLHELLRTIEHATSERQLNELGQIRYEQETVGEIERRRQRLGLSDSGGGSITNQNYMILILSLLAAIFTISYGASQPFVVRSWAQIVIALVIPTTIVLFIIDRKKRTKLRKNRFYYEMDIQLDAPLGESEAHKLLIGKFDMPSRKDWWVPPSLSTSKYGPHRSPYCTHPEQRSYRFGQYADAEAINKIHYETDIHWPLKTAPEIPSSVREWLHNSGLYRSTNIMEHCEITYEILYHRPSRTRRFNLREIRFITTSDHILTSYELTMLKLVIVNRFINPWLQPEDKVGYDSDSDLLPLFALTITQLN